MNYTWKSQGDITKYLFRNDQDNPVVFASNYVGMLKYCTSKKEAVWAQRMKGSNRWVTKIIPAKDFDEAEAIVLAIAILGG